MPQKEQRARVRGAACLCVGRLPLGLQRLSSARVAAAAETFAPTLRWIRSLETGAPCCVDFSAPVLRLPVRAEGAERVRKA